MERSHVDPVTRSLASLLSAGAAGGCKVSAVNCCTIFSEQVARA